MAVSFGVVLLVNEKPVALRPKQVAAVAGGAAADLKRNGMELELDGPVMLGTPGGAADGLEEFVKKFDPDFTMPKKTEMPTEISGVVDKLSNVEITIEKFHLKIPGSTPSGAKTQYTFGMSAIFPSGDELGVDGIPVALKGLFLEVSNEAPPVDPAVTP